MATKKVNGTKDKSKAPTNSASQAVSAADLEALGFAPEPSKTLGGSKFPTISVEKIGFNIKSEGGQEPCATFEGIIIHEHPLRTYYASSEVGNTPPDCYSTDGVVGSKFGACQNCRHLFQNAANEARRQGLKRPAEQYCRDKHALYVVRETGGLAHLLRLPTMSVSRWQLYLQQLKTLGKHYAQQRTTFSVTTRKNAGGQPYGECNFAVGKPVALAELQGIAGQAKMLREQPSAAQIPEHAESQQGTTDDGF